MSGEKWQRLERGRLAGHGLETVAGAFLATARRLAPAMPIPPQQPQTGAVATKGAKKVKVMNR